MALEDTLAKLIASIDANTAALKGSKGASGGSAVTTTATTATKPKKDDKPDFDALKVVANKVMEKHGKPFAKKMIKDVGGATELAVVKPEKYPALVKAFEAALADSGADEDDAGEEDEL